MERRLRKALVVGVLVGVVLYMVILDGRSYLISALVAIVYGVLANIVYQIFLRMFDTVRKVIGSKKGRH